jgi:hypothetical protein
VKRADVFVIVGCLWWWKLEYRRGLPELTGGEDLIVRWAELGTIDVDVEKEDKGITMRRETVAASMMLLLLSFLCSERVNSVGWWVEVY